MKIKNEVWANYAALLGECQLLEAGGALKNSPRIGMRCEMGEERIGGIHRLVQPSIFVRSQDESREIVFPVHPLSSMSIATFEISHQTLLLWATGVQEAREVCMPDTLLLLATSHILLWKSRVVRFEIDRFGVSASIVLTRSLELLSVDKLPFGRVKDLEFFFEPHHTRAQSGSKPLVTRQNANLWNS